MWREVNESLLAALKGHPAVAARLPALEAGHQIVHAHGVVAVEAHQHQLGSYNFV